MGEDRREHRRDDQRAAVTEVAQPARAEVVHRREERAPTSIPDYEGEVADQMFGQLSSPAAIRRQHVRCISGLAVHLALMRKSPSQVVAVVEAAVENDREIVAGERLRLEHGLRRRVEMGAAHAHAVHNERRATVGA